MRCSYLSALAPLLAVSFAETLVTPQVNQVVRKVPEKSSGYIHHTGSADDSTTTTSHLTTSKKLLSIDLDVSTGVDVSIELDTATASYWYEELTKQGTAPETAAGYAVYRNVQDYGAKGDGVTDDTAAINSAITDGNRCGKGCGSSTETPAVVYFPAGTYLISSPIIPYYYTSLVGNPNFMPTIKACAAFSGMGLIDGNPYYNGSLNWGSTNVFFRQVRNLILDTTGVAAASSIEGMHWPTSQATSIQNVVFNLNADATSGHVGLFIESGSAGFLSDLVFNGGLYGAQVGNQQFTMRNLTFNNCNTAIYQLWSWSWTYIGLNINNCNIGINFTANDPTDIKTGGLMVIDSTFADTPVGLSTAKPAAASDWTNGTLALENVVFTNVPTVLQGPDSAVLIGGSTGTTTVDAWGAGHEYTPTGPVALSGTFPGASRPTALVGSDGTSYYQMSKPQFESLTAADIYSVRTAGAVGDGTTDDTTAVQQCLDTAAAAGQVCFFDMGIYLVTSTVTIPVGSKVVGEWYPIIMSSGEFFNDQTNPQPVVKVGNSGDCGLIQWTDMIVAGQGNQQGAIMIEYNLAGTSGTGMWDVHTRIGGFAGSGLQVSQCPTNSTTCLGAFMSVHVTKTASNAYLENCWFWTADHDMDDTNNTRVSIYSGRGMLVESTEGGIWLVGTAVEHHALYNYQFLNTKDVFGVQLQSETPYYMPSPDARNAGYTYNATWSDPDYATSCAFSNAMNCAMAWGLRVVNSTGFFIYGSDHYSFFSSYSTTCSDANGSGCQASIISIEDSSAVNIYHVNTVGTACQLTEDSTCQIQSADNLNVYNELAVIFRTG